MEKKQYIIPAMRVKAVNMLLMAGISTNDEEGDGGDLSKETVLPEDEGNISTHDIWED